MCWDVGIVAEPTIGKTVKLEQQKYLMVVVANCEFVELIK
jgi:hypothetical protein